MSGRILAAVFLVLGIAACGNTNAQQVIKRHGIEDATPVATVIARSDAVILAHVYGAAKPFLNKSGTESLTDWSISVRTWFKGRGAAEIAVRTLGGKVGGVEYQYDDQPDLRIGQDVVLCLTLERGTRRDLNGEYYVSFNRRGVFSLAPNGLVNYGNRLVALEEFQQIVASIPNTRDQLGNVFSS